MSTEREELIARLKGCADDPMWAYHASISKVTLRRIINELAALSDAPKVSKPVAWARNTAGGISVCYTQAEPPHTAPWGGASDEQWIPLYTTPPAPKLLDYEAGYHAGRTDEVTEQQEARVDAQEPPERLTDAPELLEELRVMVALMRSRTHLSDVALEAIDKAQAAIDKAAGAKNWVVRPALSAPLDAPERLTDAELGAIAMHVQYSCGTSFGSPFNEQELMRAVETEVRAQFGVKT